MFFRFVYKTLINNKEYPEGCGKSSKEAKQNAARLALNELQQQADLSSTVYLLKKYNQVL